MTVRSGLLIIFLMSPLSACINWQGAYDHAAREDCRRQIESTAISACLAQVDANAREKSLAKTRPDKEASP